MQVKTAREINGCTLYFMKLNIMQHCPYPSERMLSLPALLWEFCSLRGQSWDSLLLQGRNDSQSLNVTQCLAAVFRSVKLYLCEGQHCSENISENWIFDAFLLITTVPVTGSMPINSLAPRQKHWMGFNYDRCCYTRRWWRQAKLSYCCKVGEVDFIGSFSKRVTESPKQLLCSACRADSGNQPWFPCLYIRRQCWLAVRRELITHSQIHSSDCKHNEFNTNKHWSAFIATDE